MSTANRTIPLTVALSSIAAWAHAAETARLEHNPFARPPSEVTVEAGGQLQADGSIAPIDLRATMVADINRLANVAGKTLRPGDEVQGYTLLQVFEDRAVFLRDGKRLTVYVKPELVEDDE